MTRKEKLPIKKLAIEGITGALGFAMVQSLGVLVGKLKVEFGNRPSVKSWRRRPLGKRQGSYGHNFVVPFDWIEKVYATGLTVVDSNLILQAEPTPPPEPAEAAWQVLYTMRGTGGIKLTQLRWSVVVQYAGVRRLHVYPEEALQLCILEYKQLLGLEPTPLPF